MKKNQFDDIKPPPAYKLFKKTRTDNNLPGFNNFKSSLKEEDEGLKLEKSGFHPGKFLYLADWQMNELA